MIYILAIWFLVAIVIQGLFIYRAETEHDEMIIHSALWPVWVGGGAIAIILSFWETFNECWMNLYPKRPND